MRRGISPHQVKRRKNASKLRVLHEAFSVDRISCMDHTPASTSQWKIHAGIDAAMEGPRRLQG